MDVASYLERLLRKDVLLSLLGLYLAQLVVYRAYKIFIYPYFVSPLRQLPGPKNHHFLIGHILNQIRSGHPNEPYLSWMRQWPRTPHGLIRYLDVGNSDAVLVTGLAAHKEILHDKCYSFQKPPFFKRLIADTVGFGLVFTEGEEHKKQRRLLAGLFSPGNLRALVPLFRDKASHLSNLLDQIIETEGGVVDLVSLYSKVMLDIMGVFALGVELGNLESANSNTENPSFDECYHELFEPDSWGQILMGLNAVVPVRWLPFEANRRFKRALSTLRNQLMAIIRDRIRTVGEWKAAGTDSDTYKGKDLLTFMVAEKYYADGDDRWTPEYIMEQILTFIAAGHETTASGLLWGTQLMIEHPGEAKRLRDEIDELLRREPVPDQRSIENLPYLHNFTREALRLQAPGVNVAREAVEDVVVQGIVLPKGTTILIQPAIVNRNPTIWGPDCDKFRPDRWDSLEGEAADPWAFATFALGPRVCIGKAMTMLEFKIILVELVSKFDIEGLVPNTKVCTIKHLNPSVLLRPEGGLRVRVKRRRAE
ncbi:cytochrome P450 [Corynascus similis CBS 632.67]